MEWFTAILTGLLTLFSSAGIVLDTVLGGQIRRQVKQVEQMSIRLDNTPSYQILQGKVDKIRLAIRGVYPISGLRIDTIALETDPLSLDLKRLQGKGNGRFSQALRQSAQGAIKIVLKEKDLNRALASPQFKARLQQWLNRALPGEAGASNRDFTLLGAEIDFLPPGRIQAKIKLQQLADRSGTETLEMVIAADIKTRNGKNIEILEPSASLNGRPISKRLLNGFAQGLSEQLDLARLEKDKILVRILELEIEEQQIDLAAFVRVEPDLGEQ